MWRKKYFKKFCLNLLQNKKNFMNEISMKYKRYFLLHCTKLQATELYWKELQIFELQFTDLKYTELHFSEFKHTELE